MEIFLGHGASGTAASMRPFITGLRKRGFDATALTLPKGKAERAVPALLRQVPEEHSDVVIGGHSYGGRVASMAADDEFSALILLSYPLHRPGHPDEWEERVAHWKKIRCPVILFSGESDPFAKIDLLRKAVRKLKNAELVTYPRIGHGVIPVIDDVLDRIADFL